MLQAMAGAHDADGRGFPSHAATPASGAAKPVDYKAWRQAECQKVAMPRRRNREETLAAYQHFTKWFHDSPEQRSKDHSKKRSCLNAYLEAVFGHRHGVYDYLLTGEVPSLRPACRLKQ